MGRSHDTPRDGALAELEELCRRFNDLGRRVFLDKPHARDVVRTLPPLDLPLVVDLSGRRGTETERAQAILEHLHAHLDDAILSHAAFRPGHVFCFFCERADCEHGSPADSHKIFKGYGHTGLPIWVNLLDRAIELGHDDVERLTAERGAAIIIETSREALLDERLPGFERIDRAYDVRGQVALGYFRAGGRVPATASAREREAPPEQAGKFAVTIQIIRSATRSRIVRLGANAIGRLPDGSPVESLIGSGRPFAFLELLAATERRLAAINQDLKRAPIKVRLDRAAVEADKLLASLRHEFGRSDRRGQRRTDHATQRAREKTRPTGMAHRDVKKAKADRVFHDRKEDTWVIVGANGRTHVFTTRGLHVTSLHLERKSLESRIAQRRWRPLDGPEAADVIARTRSAFEAAKKDPDRQDW